MSVSGNVEFDVKADPAAVMAAVAAVEDLPKRSEPHRSAHAETFHDDGRPYRVRAEVNAAGITDEQVTDYTWDGDRKVTWTLIESKVQSKQIGSYTLTPTDAGTHVRFDLEIDVKVPVPGFMLKRVLKGALDNGSKNFAKYVESR